MKPKLTTIDLEEYKLWLQGYSFRLKRGVGITVNEIEAAEADAALERGEPVLLRSGSKLINRYITLSGTDVVEHEGHPPEL
jgi:hypothetical protein